MGHLVHEPLEGRLGDKLCITIPVMISFLTLPCYLMTYLIGGGLETPHLPDSDVAPAPPDRAITTNGSRLLLLLHSDIYTRSMDKKVRKSTI